MFTDEEIELGKAALKIAHADNPAHHRVIALRMLYDECGWTLRRADQVLAHLLELSPLAKRSD